MQQRTSDKNTANWTNKFRMYARRDKIQYIEDIHRAEKAAKHQQ